MTDLDLPRIKGRLAILLEEGDVQADDFYKAAALVVLDMPALVAEVERLRDEVRTLENSDALDIVTANAEIKRLKRLLGPPDMPTVDSYESMAQALDDERAETVRHCDRIATLERLLAEILRYFPKGFPGIGVRSDEVLGETLDRWRSHLERAS